MGYKVMVTVDLNNKVTTDQRDSFNGEMKKMKWSKIESLTTTWKASFQDDVTHSSAVSITKNDIAKAAKQSGINSYDGSLMVGEQSPSVF